MIVPTFTVPFLGFGVWERCYAIPAQRKELRHSDGRHDLSPSWTEKHHQSMSSISAATFFQLGKSPRSRAGRTVNFLDIVKHGTCHILRAFARVRSITSWVSFESSVHDGPPRVPYRRRCCTVKETHCGRLPDACL